jgi:hypothetical protein
VSATRMPRWGVKWVGLDVARDAIAVGVLDGSSESAPRLEKVAHDEVSIRRLVSRLGEPSRLRVCYEAGPTGYELHRLLMSMRVACEVVAPSLVPVAPGEKVKTDRRDARRLVRLYRAGETPPRRITRTLDMPIHVRLPDAIARHQHDREHRTSRAPHGRAGAIDEGDLGIKPIAVKD